MGICLSEEVADEKDYVIIRWYVAPSDGENLMGKSKDQAREIWDREIKAGTPPYKIITIAGRDLGCSLDAVRVLDFIESIAVPEKLTFQGLCYIVGTMLNGTKHQQADFMFTAIDQDGSGSLDRVELGEVIKLQNMKSASSIQGYLNVLQVADELLGIVDTDRNGFISKEEFIDAQQIIMARLLYVQQAVM